MEYQCFYLNPEYQLGHDDDAPVLFESDSLPQAINFVYNDWLANKRDIAVWQPRTRGYREIYRDQPRDELGRFTRR